LFRSHRVGSGDRPRGDRPGGPPLLPGSGAKPAAAGGGCGGPGDGGAGGGGARGGGVGGRTDRVRERGGGRGRGVGGGVPGGWPTCLGAGGSGDFRGVMPAPGAVS